MADHWNTQGVEPYEWSEPSSARQVAEAIAAGCLEPDLDVSAAVSVRIDEAAQEILHGTEVESYLDYDTDRDRDFYDFGNGYVGVHWIAGESVEGGTAEELAEKWVAEFRESKECELMDTHPSYVADSDEDPEGFMKIFNEVFLLAEKTKLYGTRERLLEGFKKHIGTTPTIYRTSDENLCVYIGEIWSDVGTASELGKRWADGFVSFKETPAIPNT